MAEPVFQHGHLRLYLLQTLANGPRHGYDIIASLTARFGGRYRPSAGSVYPRLGKLVNEGLLSVRHEGRKRMYELTDAGRAELAAKSAELAEVNELVDESVQQRALDLRARIAESLESLQAEFEPGDRSAEDRNKKPVEPEVSGSQQALRAEAEVLLATTSSRLLVEFAQAAARDELTPERIRAFVNALNNLRV